MPNWWRLVSLEDESWWINYRESEETLKLDKPSERKKIIAEAAAIEAMRKLKARS